LFIKLGIAPFHSWLVDVYRSISFPLLAFFAVLSKFSILILLIRLYFLTVSTIFVDITKIGWVTTTPAFIAVGEISFVWFVYLTILAVFSIAIGSFGMFFRSNIKVLFAYSSILNVGFIILNLSTATTIGLKFSWLYIVLYLLTTLIIFMLFEFLRIFSYNGTLNFNFLGQLQNHQNPGFVILIFNLLVLSLAGLPPFAGFFLKYFTIYNILFFDKFLLALVGVLLNLVALVGYLKFISALSFGINLEVGGLSQVFVNKKERFFYLLHKICEVNKIKIVFWKFTVDVLKIFVEIYLFVIIFVVSFNIFFLFYLDKLLYFLDYFLRVVV
jgi:NADH-quinone oxidoreductase subunit N